MTSAEYMRSYRARHGGLTIADRAQSRAGYAAIRYVRNKHPRVWRRLLDEAYAELGAQRKRAGRTTT